MNTATQVTIATSTGALWLALVLHFSAGLIAIVAGFVGIAVKKGGLLHRRSGIVFVCSMTATGLFALGIAIYEGKPMVAGILLLLYLVFTSFAAVRPLPFDGRNLNAGLMVLAFVLSAWQYALGYEVYNLPGHQTGGVPAGMILFLATVTLLAGIGDARMIRAGGIQGTARIARHLWRMCFAFFFASGSFFLGQMKFIPKPLHIMPILFALALSPLVALVYWMWRVRVRGKLQGVILQTAPAPATRMGLQIPRYARDDKPYRSG